MRELVLDASVVSQWIPKTRSGPAAAALALAAEFEAGRLSVVVPTFLQLELLNIAGRQWRWPQQALTELVAFLLTLRFEFIEPELDRVVAWIGRGLTSYDAAYVAVAEMRGATLVTTDREILEVAPAIAAPLVSGG